MDLRNHIITSHSHQSDLITSSACKISRKWGGRWEGELGWGTHVNPWLIHVNVWQKALQYAK